MKEIDDLKAFYEERGLTKAHGVKLDVALFDTLDKRISKLEGGIVASADALADLEYRHLKRIEALEAHDKCQNCAVSPYIEAEPKPLSCCEGCADWPCETSQILKGDAPGWTPDCYREKHICGECKHLGKESGANAFECWRHAEGRHVWFMCKESDACPNFEAIR